MSIEVKYLDEIPIHYGDSEIGLYIDTLKKAIVNYESVSAFEVLESLIYRFGFAILAITLREATGWMINKEQLDRYKSYSQDLEARLLEISGEDFNVELNIELLDIVFVCHSAIDGLSRSTPWFTVEEKLSTEMIRKLANLIWFFIQSDRQIVPQC